MSEDIGRAASNGGSPMVPGRWHAAWESSAGYVTLVPSNNNRYMTSPILIARPCVLTGVAIDVTSASEAGGVVHLGLHADVNGVPGPLVADLGTVAADAIAVVQVACSVPLLADWYWLGAAPQLCPTTRPTVRSLANNFASRVGNSAPGGNQPFMGYYADAVSGAPPANWITSTQLSAVPAFWIKS